RRRHTTFSRDWSSDVCSSDLSPDDVATLERTLRDIVAVAYRELAERWGELIADAPGPSTDALAAHLPDLVERYADAAGAVAADRSGERRVGNECGRREGCHTG